MSKKTVFLFPFFSILFALFLAAGFAFTHVKPVLAATEADEENDDADLYAKYEKYLKRKKYKDYKDAKKKYGFNSTAERLAAKEKYRLYKDNPKKFAKYYESYKRYRDYKNKYKEKYGDYAKFSKYDKATYAKYGKTKYKNGHDRYKKVLAAQSSSGGDSLLASSGSLGPEISVGVMEYDSDYAKKHDFEITASKSYAVKDKDGSVIATVSGSTESHVVYAGDNNVRVYGNGFDRTVSREVNFEAADGNNGDLIINIEPKSNFDSYRGKMRLRFSVDTKKLWAINILPLEQYSWGMGEITGTGPSEYNKVMSVVYRTYGYWKIKYSTKYAGEGFKVDATSSSQVYYGYDWETGHTRIREAVEATRGRIVRYEDRIAITPYSSSTDGRTRSWKERWGSSNYPWCKSVDDPYGKKANAGSIDGNHMVGLSATGALNLADDHNWGYEKILKYYYTGITIAQEY